VEVFALSSGWSKEDSAPMATEPIIIFLMALRLEGIWAMINSWTCNITKSSY
jgi:hypothetical protein